MSGFYNTFKDDTKTLKFERFLFLFPRSFSARAAKLAQSYLIQQRNAFCVKRWCNREIRSLVSHGSVAARVNYCFITNTHTHTLVCLVRVHVRLNECKQRFECEVPLSSPTSCSVWNNLLYPGGADHPAELWVSFWLPPVWATPWGLSSSYFGMSKTLHYL